MLHALLLDTSAWLVFILCTYVYDVFLCGILQYWVLLLSGLRLRYACWFMLKPTHHPYFVNPNLLFSDYEYQQCYDHCVKLCRIMSRSGIVLNLHFVEHAMYALFAVCRICHQSYSHISFPPNFRNCLWWTCLSCELFYPLNERSAYLNAVRQKLRLTCLQLQTFFSYRGADKLSQNVLEKSYPLCRAKCYAPLFLWWILWFLLRNEHHVLCCYYVFLR